MSKLFSYLLILGVICAAYSNTEDDVCRSLIPTQRESDCIPISECSILHNLVNNKRILPCGIDKARGVSKVCCPKKSQRFSRQTNASSKKDPYLIARQKCNEYANARYVVKSYPSEIPGRPNVIIRKVECVVSEPLIVGGIAAKVKEFPHMALIGFSDRIDKSINKTGWHCGGTLISDRFVLTAAHCMKSGEYEATWVRLGELVLHNDSDSAQPRDFRIAERIPHPQYTASSVYFDIMLLRLRERVEFTPHMRPICLYTAPVLVSALHNQALISGWGATAADEKQSDALLKAKVHFSEDNICFPIYKGDKNLARGFDPTTMICAGNKIHGNDTCGGDSGGPLQVPIPNWSCMYSQVGITSYGARICGQKAVPTIYTKVSAFIPWIQSIVWP